MKLYLTPDMEIQANEVQVQHSNILVDPIIEDLEMYLEREIPVQYASWTFRSDRLIKGSILRTKLNNDHTQHGLCPADYRGNA